jgi:hypothetical protein
LIPHTPDGMMCEGVIFMSFPLSVVMWINVAKSAFSPWGTKITYTAKWTGKMLMLTFNTTKTDEMIF